MRPAPLFPRSGGKVVTHESAPSPQRAVAQVLLFDLPLGDYKPAAVQVLPDGMRHPLKVPSTSSNYRQKRQPSPVSAPGLIELKSWDTIPSIRTLHEPQLKTVP